MSEKKPMPQCPYCGWEMRYHFDYPMNYCDVQFYCQHCNAMSPSARGCQTNAESVETALEEAYEKAMRRYEAPNRVLTLEEACEAEVCWTETPQTSLAEACRIVMREYTSFPEGKPAKSFDFYETGETVPWCYHPEEYGVLVRCWLRKPTTKEMANTPWEAKHNEH